MASGPPSTGSSTSRRPPAALGPLVLLFVIQGLFLLGISTIASRGSIPLELVPVDAVVPPGTAVRAGARILREGSAGAITLPSELRVTFTPGGSQSAQPAASVALDADGFAPLPFSTTSPAGSFSFRATLSGAVPPGLVGQEVSVDVSVVPPEARLLLVEWEELSAYPGAAAHLGALGASHSIVYLSLRPSSNPARVKQEIRKHGLPPGPVWTARTAGSAGRLNTLLSELQAARWKEKPWAILPSNADPEPLTRNGLRVLILGPGVGEAPPGPLVALAPTWEAARKTIETGR